MMMAAMMLLPTAFPMVFEFARHSERRNGWQVATGLLIATYLAFWIAFGVVAYLVNDVLHVPRVDQKKFFRTKADLNVRFGGIAQRLRHYSDQQSAAST